jgi:DNA topoisomerase-1
VRDAAAPKRIRALAIPPAERQVWIRSDADGRVRATGRDERGRERCRYDATWREQQDTTKHHRPIAFARTRLQLRARVSGGMARRGLPREKVPATAVHRVEAALIRIGNADRARTNRGHGSTTLRGQHVVMGGPELCSEFRGKSRRLWRLEPRDPHDGRVVRACQERPGQDQFGDIDADGAPRASTSFDVNACLVMPRART